MPTTKSHWPLSRYSRTNPRPILCQMKVRCALRSRATSAAMRFSKPVSSRLENGMLWGSAHTRNSRVWAFAPTAEMRKKKPTNTLRQGEYIKHSPLIRVMRQVLHGCGESQGCGFIASVQAARHDRPCPTAHAGQDGDILFSVRPLVRYGLADNSRSSFELPEERPAMGVDSFEPSVERPVEHNVSRSGKRSAPHREMIRKRPHDFSFDWIPGGEFSPVSPRCVVHAYIRSNVRSAGDIVRCEILFIHAQVIVGDIKQSSSWRKCRRLPVFSSRCSRTQSSYHFSRDRLLLINVLKVTCLQIHS